MLRRLITAALIAGSVVGFGITALQQVTTAPLLLQAERFEARAPEHTNDAPHWRAGRILLTTATNVVVGAGFALLLAACFAFHGGPTTARTGILWGMGGLAVFTLGPGLGLPPELPGMAAGDLPARQLWWFLSVGCTAAGMWLLVFGRIPAAKLVGALLIAVPLAVGAPHADQLSHIVPAELAARFAAVSIAVSAVFWTSLGFLTGTLYGRMLPSPEWSAAAEQAE